MSSNTKQQITDFFEQYHSHEFDKNEVVVKAGDPIRSIHYVERGQVREYDISGSGNEVVVNVLKPGAFFSLTQAISNDEYLWFYETLQPSSLRVAPVEDVVEFVQANANVAFDLLGRVSKGATGVQRRMAHLMGGSARSRVLFELITEFSRFGVPTKDGKLKLDITEAQLASRAGLSREAVSKQLAKLRTEKMVEAGYGTITATSLDKLRKELGQQL